MKNKTSFTIDILLCITLISSLFYCLVTSFDIKTEWYIIVVPTAIFCTIYGLLASLVKKSGVLFYQRGNHYDCFCIYFAVFT